MVDRHRLITAKIKLKYPILFQIIRSKHYIGWEIKRTEITAEEVSKFQCLSPNPHLVDAKKGIRSPKTHSIRLIWHGRKLMFSK